MLVLHSIYITLPEELGRVSPARQAYDYSPLDEV